ncbi:MAG: LacI family DNA-binding transcriptional regulator [Candidatus Acidiferrales bacterium]
MSTVKDIAKRARVSVGTVSNVLTDALPVSAVRRERVLAAIRELDYHPNAVARSLKLRRTKMLGMIISDITNPFFPQLVRGAEDAALQRGYLLITFNTDDRIEREKQVLSVLRTRRVDGVMLVIAPSAGDVTHIRSTLASGIAIVCLDRLPRGIHVDSVTVDNASGARECVQHLLSLGHRRIAMITGSRTLQTARERLRGYKEAFREAGLPVSPEWVREGDFRSESGYRLGIELLSGDRRPSALFVANGMMALGVLKALEALSVNCPRDIALATFDDLPLFETLRPHLTAVAQPAYAIGRKGVELILQRIESKQMDDPPVTVRLPTELKIRQSTPAFRKLPG